MEASLTIANTNIFLWEDLSKSKSAENARAARKLKPWQCAQQGNLVYASEGRQIAKTREEANLAKAQALVQQEEGKAEKIRKEEEEHQKEATKEETAHSATCTQDENEEV